jgi:hypothetical protein
VTLHALYYRAATLRLAHELGDARTVALDDITSRRIVTRLPNHDPTASLTNPCRCTTCNWRRAGARAARVTMDRGYDAVVARLEARDRMTAEIPWRVPEVSSEWSVGRRRGS